MKTENIFKFVSVRPPQKKDQDDMGVIQAESGVITGILQQLETVRTIQKISLHEARLIVGKNLINSDKYFTKHAGWKALLPYRLEVHNLLRAVRSGASFDKFRVGAQSLFEGIYGAGFNLEGFVQGEVFRSLQDSIWTSCYAGILNPLEHPHEREEVGQWITFLHLLEAAKNEEQYNRTVMRLGKWRPGVPFEFYKGEPLVAPPGAPEEDQTEADQARADQIDRLRGAIRKLRSLKAELERLGAGKMKQFLNVHVQEGPGQIDQLRREITTLRSAVTGLQNELGALKGQAAGQTPSPSLDQPGQIFDASAIHLSPWRLSPEETEELRAKHPAVLELEVDLDLETIPAVIYKIEERIAFLEAELNDLSMEAKIIGVGRTFVKVIRPAGFHAKIQDK